MSVSATEIRKGSVISEGGQLYLVADFQHVTKGNWRGYFQLTVRNLATGTSSERRCRSTDKVELAALESTELEYLYPEGDTFCFMDTTHYEQYILDKGTVENIVPYLRMNDKIRAQVFQGKPVVLELPASVVLKVVDSEPGVRGNSATNIFKPAKLETGLTVKVPLFVEPGEHVKIDTRTGQFLERANAPI